MSVAADNRGDAAKKALYDAITQAVKDAESQTPATRLERLRILAEAYGHITYGHGR